MELLTCKPRWATARNPDLETDGALLERVANVMGFSLYGWQRLVADVALEKLDGYYYFRTVGVGVGRQSGKSKLVETRIALELLKPRRQVAYTARGWN